MGALSWQHLLIVLLIVLVLFGGKRLAGLGKSTGRALREFKEETRGLRDRDDRPYQVEADDRLDEPRRDETRRGDGRMQADDRLDEPRRDETRRGDGRRQADEPDRYETDRHEPRRYETDRYEADRHEQDRYDRDRYDRDRYDRDRYEPPRSPERQPRDR